mmetsp:Transcript_31335/g.48045  ORF Transcript_31335/g.48045 Transcript_31335/m.48045 type:complete len:675 (-) Transcript_31335:341-2365(-)
MKICVAVDTEKSDIEVAQPSLLKSHRIKGLQELDDSMGSRISYESLNDTKWAIDSSATVRFAIYGALFGATFPLIATILDILTQGLDFSIKSVIQVHSDQPLHWIINTAPLFLGLVASLVGIRQERITNFNSMLEQRVRERTVELEQASRAKSDFLATMSHEIRTPLNGVIGMTGLLLDTNLSKEQKDYAETARASGEALLSVINDILDFSKIEAQKVELEVVDFNLRAAVEETVDLVAHKADQQNIELVFLINHDMPLLLRGDPGRLRQILLNLLTNAIKFTSKGEVVLSVELQSETDTDCTARFQVTDTGVGIPESRIEHLFEPFTQVDASTTRQYGGSGLGLAICKELCTMMNGKIGLSSQEGKGSTFWFTVDLIKQDSMDLKEQDLPMVSMKKLQGLKVLVVDDNATNRRVSGHHLRNWKCVVDEAESGSTALHKLSDAAQNNSQFQLVLMDHQMPGMDGEMLARCIRSDPRLSSVLLMMCTSLSRRGDTQRLKGDGFAGYLVKPIKPFQLLDSIALVLGSSSSTVDPTKRPLITREISNRSITRARILVVEDNLVNQKVAVRMLQKDGCRCDVAANGREALDATMNISYDLVLMDCQMPIMDGYVATRQIRLAGKKQLPIIAMTANAMEGDRQRCIDAGMDDFITKPVKKEILLTRVRCWLDRRNSIRS